MTGLRYGRLTGIGYSHTQCGHAHWLFACDCGGEVVVNGAAVRAGKTESCGCLHREVSAARLTRHGRRANKRHDATYRAWQEINTACADRASPRFRDHGARGIAVCADWRIDFEAFLADMGERPPETTLSRIDRTGDFMPGNCRWAPLAPRAERARRGWERMQRPGAL